MSWIRVLEQNELPEGERRVVKVADRTVLLLHHQGHVYATALTCPHQGASLERGKVTSHGIIVCPMHHRAYDLESGAVKTWSPWPAGEGHITGDLPQEKPLPVYPTRLEDGSLWIDADSLMP